VGSFHTRLFIIFVIGTASVRNVLDIPSYMPFDAAEATQLRNALNERATDSKE
jgi:hypothetical protein